MVSAMGDQDQERGLYRKYDITRTDGSSGPGGKHHNCTYFVLDLTHDPYAIPALQAYAEACKESHPALSRQLALVAKSRHEPGCGCREAMCPHVSGFGSPDAIAAAFMHADELGLGPASKKPLKRNIDEVIGKMLPLIPTGEPEVEQLRELLGRVVRDSGYTPPEGQFIFWRRVGNALYHVFGGNEPTDGWQRDVLDVFMGRNT